GRVKVRFRPRQTQFRLFRLSSNFKAAYLFLSHRHHPMELHRRNGQTSPAAQQVP
ncbi:hypothetical protein S245_048601, partial [Arachis hypogaea]